MIPAVAALLAYAGFCYKGHESIVRDGRTWISEYLNVVASRQGEALREVLRDVLPELTVSFFSLPPGEPPLSDAELADALGSIQSEAEPDSKAYTYRERITRPVVAHAVRDLVQRIGEIGDLSLTPGGEKALLDLRLPVPDTNEVQHALRRLEGWYLLEVVLSAVGAMLLIAAGILQHYALLVAGASAILLLIPFVLVVEYSRGALRQTLDIERTSVELREGR